MSQTLLRYATMRNVKLQMLHADSGPKKVPLLGMYLAAAQPDK